MVVKVSTSHQLITDAAFEKSRNANQKNLAD